MVIQKFQYEFKVNVYKTDDELYSIFVFSRDRTDKSATTTFAKLELVSALTKDKILNNMEQMFGVFTGSVTVSVIKTSVT